MNERDILFEKIWFAGEYGGVEEYLYAQLERLLNPDLPEYEREIDLLGLAETAREDFVLFLTENAVPPSFIEAVRIIDIDVNPDHGLCAGSASETGITLYPRRIQSELSESEAAFNGKYRQADIARVYMYNLLGHELMHIIQIHCISEGFDISRWGYQDGFPVPSTNDFDVAYPILEEDRIYLEYNEEGGYKSSMSFSIIGLEMQAMSMGAWFNRWRWDQEMVGEVDWQELGCEYIYLLETRMTSKRQILWKFINEKGNFTTADMVATNEDIYNLAYKVTERYLEDNPGIPRDEEDQYFAIIEGMLQTNLFFGYCAPNNDSAPIALAKLKELFEGRE